MTPAEQAALVYTLEPCSHSFEHDLFWHLRNGYVFSTPDYFIMGRPVDRTAPEHLILDVTVSFGDPNAWLVWLMAGRLDLAPGVMPYRLPFIGYQKRNRLRWHQSERLTSRLQTAQPSS